MCKVNSFVCCFMVLFAMSFSSAWAKKAEADVSAISLDVLRIDACAKGKGCVAASGPMQFNLLDLADGKVDLASKVLLPAQTKELRLVLGDNNTISVDDESFPVDVPSGKTSGLKLKGQKVFGNEGGFLASLTLSLDLKKQLVVQSKKVKAKGYGKAKKKSGVEEVLYSFKLKPVIRVKTAEVEPLPENIAAVVALPDKDTVLNLGNDSSILIPAGAISEITIIKATPRLFFIEVTDQTTGNILELPPLSPIYYLSPSGLTFDKNVDVKMHYDWTAIPKGFTEDDLVVYHDGDPIISTVDKNNKIVAAQISHFSGISIDVYFKEKCEEQPAIVNSDGKAITGITHILCPDLEVEGLNDDNLPNFHLVEGDRKSLAAKYRMDVISIDASTEGQETQPVSVLSEKNNAVVAINGNHFGCLPNGGKECQNGGAGRAERIHIEDGEVKGKDGSKENVVFAFGGNSNSLIPIERLKTSGVTEPGNFDRVFENVFSQQFPTSWQSAAIETTQSKDGILTSAIGERTTLLYIRNSKIICKPTFTDDSNDENDENDVPLAEEDPYPAFGYGENKIIFLASDENSIVSDWDHYFQFCLVLRTKQAENAILLDGGGSTQLTVRRPTGNGTEVITANNDDDTEDLRHVVNAIALVPKDQEDPEPTTTCPAGNRYYCGQSSLGQSENTLYDCQNGDYQMSKECTYGCEVITGKDDRCKCPYGNGFYCGDSQLGQYEDTLYSCQDGVFSMDKQCANGCQENANHVNDQCKGSSLLPAVDSVAPDKATLNELTTFTVTGQNLPSTLAFWIGECENVTSLGGTSTSMKFSCTPSWTTGVKNGVVKDEPGGTVLKEFTVNVSEGGSTLPESFTCTSGSQTQTWQGREWQRCDDGNTYTWQEAKDYCDNLVLGGYSDWRLPTNDELRSIVYCSNGTETPLAVYPDDPSVPYSCNSHNSAPYDRPTISSEFECKSEPYWSSTPYSKDTSYTLTVDFDYGYSSRENPITNHLYVRCVR